MGSAPLGVIERSPRRARPNWNSAGKIYRVEIARSTPLAGRVDGHDRQHFLGFAAYSSRTTRWHFDCEGVIGGECCHEDRNRSNRPRSRRRRGADRNCWHLACRPGAGGHGRRAALSDRLLPGGRRGQSARGGRAAVAGSATATESHRVTRIHSSQHLSSSPLPAPRVQNCNAHAVAGRRARPGIQGFGISAGGKLPRAASSL